MKKRYKILIAFILIITVLLISFKIRVLVEPPEVTDTSVLNEKREKINDNFYTLNKSWLKQNKYGLWELFLTGNDFELGARNGILTKELANYQEDAFVESIKEIVPSKFYINFLKYFIAWFNRDIDKHIPIEYQKEIYGVSLSASEQYEFIAPNYHRILNYHAAHDIGHTISNMNLVACTAFGVNNIQSEDSSLLIGRNMDFYVGDKFAENRIMAFYKPKKGHNFTYITWAGLIGVITGMNDKGLTISLNSAKSDLPSSAKTPVSILARTILQYASTIDEAFDIAKKYDTFVAESFLISSAKDNNFAIIEKSTDTTAIFYEKGNQIILSNHYQGDAFKNRELTIANKKENETVYRWNRTKELLSKQKQHSVNSFVDILRDKNGINNKNIGLGNEMAINQLIAHHSVVFKPEQLQIWVSVGPYPLGEYLCYDLNKIFNDSLNINHEIYNSDLTIKKDSFINSNNYKKFVAYKKITKILQHALSNNFYNFINDKLINKYKLLNPNYYYTYEIVGDYYTKLGEPNKAKENYNIALKLDIAKKHQKDNIISKIAEINND